MAGKKIAISTANAMISNYVDYLRTLRVDAKKKTEYVSFTLQEIQAWLNEVTPSTDELRIYLGVYSADSPTPGTPGRVTTIIWPYKNGKPAQKPIEGKDGDDGGHPPYNDGQGMP
ncbi:MAG TPA: hypothetical protein VFI06_15325 [Chitinophagaceae bacterium]|nr:hypothetical protein [Chitinophagaceae bacterium]